MLIILINGLIDYLCGLKKLDNMKKFLLPITLFAFLIIYNKLSAQIITTVAGDSIQGYNGDTILATSAELGQPMGVAVDASGNIYISDYANSRIRKVTVSTGIITTIAGTGYYGFSGDNGLRSEERRVGKECRSRWSPYH